MIENESLKSSRTSQNTSKGRDEATETDQTEAAADHRLETCAALNRHLLRSHHLSLATSDEPLNTKLIYTP